MRAEFQKVISDFEAELVARGKSPYTTIAYKKDLEQFFEFLTLLDVVSLNQITSVQIESFINDLTENKGYTKKSASRKLNSIRTLFRVLKQKGLIVVNPATEITHPKFDIVPPRILTKLEYRALRDVAKEDPRTFALVELLLQTGMKIGELSQLRLEDVTSGSLFIRTSGKNISREIPLNKASEAALKAYLKVRPPFSNTYVFITRTGKQMLIRNIRQVIDRCFIDVGIQNATVNDLRNTFIAHQLTHGASLEYIARIVGHRRLSSTERFLNLVRQEAEKKERLGEL